MAPVVQNRRTRISAVVAICTLVVLTAASLKAQVTTQDLTKAIKIEKLQHPYLYLPMRTSLPS